MHSKTRKASVVGLVTALLTALVAALLGAPPAQATEWSTWERSAEAEVVVPPPPLPQIRKNITLVADKSMVHAAKGNPRLRPATKPTAASASLLAGPYYLYNVGSQTPPYLVEGFQANVTNGCQAASLNTATDYHTLGELAVQNGNNIVEIGYTCDPLVNGGSSAPHFFMGYWVNGVFQGYNGGAHFSRVAGACDLIGDPATTGTTQLMVIQRYNGAWWLAIGPCWVGSIADAAWGAGVFTQANFVQAFHEIASTETKPCSDMGNGYEGTLANASGPTTAARFSSASLLRVSGSPLGNYPSTDVNLYVRSSPAIEAGSPYASVYVPAGAYSGTPPLSNIRSFFAGGSEYNAAGTADGVRLGC
jgi:hypothetical protein